MHQMRISIIKISSVVLRPKKLEIRKKNVKTVKERNENEVGSSRKFFLRTMKPEKLKSTWKFSDIVQNLVC
jgi:hypothetical protein